MHAIPIAIKGKENFLKFANREKKNVKGFEISRNFLTLFISERLKIEMHENT